ncbi:phosphoribulokinase uridine kinase family [Trichoderma arundinaceum]|uniref:Phosphoribulokinase uridine kinase family n=1 Tax=Trichoderma arundinaceum TaxID=490622 RepID=A0A395NCI0_TRIAR|nr:phosphoribulokinase uridine kinase family [Trichoderma arundinaceum]
MEPTYSFLTSRALHLLEKRYDNQHRVVVALAGPPGSGKSTLAAEVVSRLNISGSLPIAAVIPMDGFHLSRATLEKMPNSVEAFARRGASWTFDAAGVVGLVEELSKSRYGAHKKTILAPSFDHAAKDPVEGGIILGPEVRFVLIEDVEPALAMWYHGDSSEINMAAEGVADGFLSPSYKCLGSGING